MAQTPEEVKKEYPYLATTGEVSNANKYPYGLCISLSQAELDKLGLEGDCSAGDMIHLCAFARVTSVSQREEVDGDLKSRIELQITHLGIENESTENEEEIKERPSYSRTAKKLYKEGSY